MQRTERSLPVELLSCAFDWSSNEDVVRAAWVSHRWRSAARTNEQFYRRAHMDTRDWTNIAPKIIAYGLPVALSIFLHHNQPEDEAPAFIEAILACLPFTLELTVGCENSHPLQDFLRSLEISPADRMRRLELRVGNGDPDAAALPWTWPQNLFAGRATRLSFLHLHGIAAPRAPISAFNGIRHMVLDGSRQPAPDLASAFPELRTLRLHCATLAQPESLKVGRKIQSVEVFAMHPDTRLTNGDLARMFDRVGLARVPRVALYLDTPEEHETETGKIDSNIFFARMSQGLCAEFCLKDWKRGSRYLGVSSEDHSKRRSWTWARNGAATGEHDPETRYSWITHFRQTALRIVELNIDALLLNELCKFAGPAGLPELEQLSLSLAISTKTSAGVDLLESIPKLRTRIPCPNLWVLWLHTGHRFHDTAAVARIDGECVRALLGMLVDEGTPPARVQLRLSNVVLEHATSLLAEVGTFDFKVSI